MCSALFTWMNTSVTTYLAKRRKQTVCKGHVPLIDALVVSRPQNLK